MSVLRKLHSRTVAPWIGLGVSAALLGGAYIFQYGFGYAPCAMCYWQRHAHKAVMGVTAVMLILRAFGLKAAELLRWGVVLALLISFGLAAWHTGVEFGIFPGPETCSASVGDTGTSLGEVDPNNPLAFLDQKMAGPSCGEAVWHFLGLSMAAWNALISLIAAVWIATSKP
jgi:disulfide bond formation protein DsbB